MKLMNEVLVELGRPMPPLRTFAIYLLILLVWSASVYGTIRILS
jgi:hypothetical protein